MKLSQQQIWNNFDTVLLAIVKYGIYFSAFTPLIIFRNSFSPFNFGKAVFFRILVEILLACYLPLAIKYPHLRPKFSWISLGVILLVASFALSTFLGVNPSISFWGNMERMGGLFGFLHLLALFLMSTAVLKNKSDWITLFKISVLVSLISVGYGFFQKGDFKYIVGSGGQIGGRMFGTIGNAAIFCGYLLFNVYLALWLFFANLKTKDPQPKPAVSATLSFLWPRRLIDGWVKIKKIFNWAKNQKFVYLLIALVNSAAIINASVRGAAIALFLSASLFLIWLFIFRAKLGWCQELRWKHLLLISSCGLVFLFIFCQTDLKTKIPVLERLAATSGQERNTQTRLLVWGEALQAIKAKPLLGWGPENFIVPFGKYFHPKIFIGPESELVFDRAHNLFLDMAVSQGLIGLLIFCFLIGAVWVFTLKTAAREKDLATFFVFPFLLVAYILHTFFIFDLLPTYLMLFYILGFAAASSAKISLEKKSAIPGLTQKFSVIIFCLCLFLAAALAYFTGVKPAIADYIGTRGALDLAHDKYRNGVDKFNQALSFGTFVWQDIFTQFVHFHTSAIYRLEGKISEKELAGDLAELAKNSQKAIRRNPRDFNLYLYAEGVYLAQGSFLDPDKYLPQAENILKKGLAEYPRLHYFYQRLAYDVSLEKKYDESASYAQKSYEANPDFAGSKYLLGRSLILKGEEDRGFDMAISAIADDGFSNAGSILWLAIRLAEKNRYDQLAYLYGRLALSEQKYLVQSAYTYFLWGKKETALKIADRAAALSEKELGYDNLKVLSEIYGSLGEKVKLNSLLERLQQLSPPSKPKEIWIPVEEP